MATGSITSLGLGSGFELQKMLDQLKDADKAPIKAKETEKKDLQKEIDAYNKVNARLFSMKSKTLSLSLSSDFLKTKAVVSDEEILTATASDGIADSSATINVIKKARYNSWQTPGVSSPGTAIYTHPGTGITSASTAVTTETETVSILYGAADDQQEISIDLESGMSLTEIASAINTDPSNENEEGEQLALATVINNNGDYYIRISAKNGGNTADSQISVAGFSYLKSDTTISITQADSEDLMYLSIAPGTTYAETAEAINDASDNPGVTAAIVDTGIGESPYRLTLTSDTTGEDKRITTQNLPLTEVTGANDDSLNASFTINGVSYQRQTNEGITDVIAGVTLNLKKEGETSLGIQKNLESIQDNIVKLVEEFNNLLKDIKEGASTESETDSEETENPLADSYQIKHLIYDLQSTLGLSVDMDSDYKSLFDLGLSIEKDGTLTLDETVLEQAIASDPEAITDLFIGDADQDITGLGDLLNNHLTNLIGSEGLIATETDAAETKIAKLDKDITDATDRLNKRYTTLAASFVRLDTYIKQLQNESDYLTSMIDSFNKSTSA